MNLLFTLCGRGGSKGVKNKNIRSLLDIPLPYYPLGVIDHYCQRHPEDQVAVALSTDSRELMSLITRQKAVKVEIVERDGYLAGDIAPKAAVISHCLQQMEQRFPITYDMVIDLDITSPMRTVYDVENGIERKKRFMGMDCAFSVTTSRRNPYFNMIKQENDVSSVVIPSTYTTRQDAPAVYDMNASIYVYAPSALKEKSPFGFFNTNCTSFLMKDFAILDIDSEQDFELMQVVAQYFFAKLPELEDMHQRAAVLATDAESRRK